MKQAADHINNVLINDSVILSLLPSIFWEIAPEASVLPLLTYSIAEAPGATKDFGGVYTVDLFVFASTLTESALIGDTIKDQVKNNNNINWRFLGSVSGFTSDAAKEGFIKVSFNFKL